MKLAQSKEHLDKTVDTDGLILSTHPYVSNCKYSNIISPNLNVSRLVLQLSLTNPMKARC